MSKRSAATILDVLVAIGIMALLIGLLLVAVQKVRAVSGKVQTMNDLRQLSLAIPQVADITEGFVGGYLNPNPATQQIANDSWERCPLQANPQFLILRLLDGESVLGDQESPRGLRSLMVCPADPSPELAIASNSGNGHDQGGPASYAFNMAAFSGPLHYPTGLVDGQSNVIAFAVRYYARGVAQIGIAVDHEGYDVPVMSGSFLDYADPNVPVGPIDVGGVRRASFADPGWNDVVPITEGNPALTRPSVVGATFQVIPAPREAEMHQLQTPFAAGLPVAFFDGSVRIIHPAVSPTSFWSAVTPAGGEVGTLD